MSNTPKINLPGRNLRVMLGRAAAETAHGLTGTNLLGVRHDAWCPAQVRQTMPACVCSPEMMVRSMELGGNG